MFRRAKSETSEPHAPDQEASGAAADGFGKGRPTPKRRDAEAAARARAKTSAAGKPTGRKAERSARPESSKAIRQGIKEGDERYLPARDKGPVKRFVRDFVDSRLNMAEFAIPLLFISLVASGVGQQGAGTAVMNATFVVVVLDSVLLRFRLRRELNRRFPESSKKGTTFYAFTRALQFRFLRLPKPKVKIGSALPPHYY